MVHAPPKEAEVCNMTASCPRPRTNQRKTKGGRATSPIKKDTCLHHAKLNKTPVLDLSPYRSQNKKAERCTIILSVALGKYPIPPPKETGEKNNKQLRLGNDKKTTKKVQNQKYVIKQETIGRKMHRNTLLGNTASEKKKTQKCKGAAMPTSY